MRAQLSEGPDDGQEERLARYREGRVLKDPGGGDVREQEPVKEVTWAAPGS